MAEERAFFDVLEPCDEHVDGDQLLQEIRSTYECYVRLPNGAATALAEFTLGTYVFNCFSIFPRLVVTSPVKRCGKSTLLIVLNALAYKAIPFSSITGPAVYRIIDGHRPTLILDEVDTFLPENELLRGIINSSHMRSMASVARCDPKTLEPRTFSTWTPVVLGMIGSPPDTIRDRSIVVELQRKLPCEVVESIPADLLERMLPIRRKAIRWAEDNAATLLDTPRVRPPWFEAWPNSRARDNWEPLFVIASRVGGRWASDTEAAFRILEEHQVGNDGYEVLLLKDTRSVWPEGQGCLHTGELLSLLKRLVDSPWNTLGGKGLDAYRLSRMLVSFGIHPRQLKLGGVNRNGYQREDFEDAFKRYLP